jgi:hypothetical protein
MSRVPLAYDAAWWSMVFPIGMYGVASRRVNDPSRRLPPGSKFIAERYKCAFSSQDGGQQERV